MEIQWNQLIDWQYHCLQRGITGLGIPDLIIAQNAIQKGSMLYSLDHHFQLLKKIIPLEVFQ